MKRLSMRPPSPALVVSLIALFISMGGVSYGLATGSIDSREIKNSTIRSKDIRNGQVLTPDIRNSTVRGGDVRNDTLTGADIVETSLGKVPNAALADSASSAGNASTLGGLDPSAFLRSDGIARRGTTIFGTYAIRAVANPDIQDNISFGLTLASAPTPHYINFGTAPPAECPGTPSSPQAQPGHLCVYEGAAPINSNNRRVFDPVGGNDNETQPFGAGVAATATTAGQDTRVRGSWAVTAP